MSTLRPLMPQERRQSGHTQRLAIEDDKCSSCRVLLISAFRVYCWTSAAKTSAVLFEAIQAEGIQAKFCLDPDEARKLSAEDRPSLAILEHDPPRINGLETCPRDLPAGQRSRAFTTGGHRYFRARPGARRLGGRHGLADQAVYRRVRTNQGTRVGIANSM